MAGQRFRLMVIAGWSKQYHMEFAIGGREIDVKDNVGNVGIQWLAVALYLWWGCNSSRVAPQRATTQEAKARYPDTSSIKILKYKCRKGITRFDLALA